MTTTDKYDGPDICVYHADCHDGMTAAWAIWKRWGDRVRYVPAKYDGTAYAKIMDSGPIRDRHVLFVDFSLPRSQLMNIGLIAASVTVLDHHKTAEDDLREFCSEQFMSEGFADFARLHNESNNRAIRARFDTNKSGARLAWEFAHPGKRAPEVVTYVEDRDLWRFAYTETRPIHAWLTTIPQNLASWNSAWSQLADTAMREYIFGIGKILIKQQERLTLDQMNATARRMIIGGHEVPVVNLPFSMVSDGLNLLLTMEDFLRTAFGFEKGVPFAASYSDTPEGRAFSLRSTNDRLDVSEVAKKYGGGGHRNAAGFQMPHGWEGDDHVGDIYLALANKRGLSRTQVKEEMLRELYSETPPHFQHRPARRVRHKKRGTTYRVIGEARLQASAPQTDNAMMVAYRAEEDGTLWVRPLSEFEDGRFEDV